MMASDVTDFPEPDSPTMPRTWPGPRSKLTPRTARTIPSSVGNSTVRSLTSRMAPVSVAGRSTKATLGTHSSLARIEGVSKAVTYEVDCQGDDDDEEAREVEQPRAGLGCLYAVRNQRA